MSCCFLARFLAYFQLNVRWRRPCLNSQGQTAIMLAAAKDDLHVLLDLLNGGASVNLKDPSGKTALMYAIEKKKAENIDLLLQYASNVWITDNDKKTAIDYAKERGLNSAVSLIEQYGNGPYVEFYNAKPINHENQTISKGLIRWLKIPRYPGNVNRSLVSGLVVVECKVVGEDR